MINNCDEAIRYGTYTRVLMVLYMCNGTPLKEGSETIHEEKWEIVRVNRCEHLVLST